MDRTTGKVEVTAHNHGFAVDAPLDAADRDAVRRRRRSATSASTTTWSRGSSCATTEGGCKAFSVQYHPEAAAGPHDAAYLFDRFVRPDERGSSADAAARRHHESVLVIGSGPIVIGQACEFDYSGTQACRVLQGRGPAGRPGQLQPGDDHDRPGVRRRDVHRADHAGVRREGDRRRSAPTRCSRRSAARPRSTPRWRWTQAGVLEKYGVELIGASIEAIEPRREPRVFKQIVEALGGEVARSRDLPHDGRLPRPRSSELGYPVVVRPVVHDGRRRLRAWRYDEDDLRRIAGAGLARQPDHRGAPRGVDPRLEGVRARGHARHRRQRRDRLLDREPRPDGRAHRRLDHRRAGDDADRPRVPAHARPRDRRHPRGRRRHRRLQHPVRGQPATTAG